MDLSNIRLLAVLLAIFYIATSEASVPLSKYYESRDEQDSMDDVNSQRIRDEDLRKLILKKLRFRDLDDQLEPMIQEAIARNSLQSTVKRNGGINSALVDRVAALLSGLKTRQIESPSVRMPSLRFGK